MKIPEKKPIVSVIVASHRSMWIEELGENLLTQDYRYCYEVIIITDYNNDTFRKRFPEIHWHYLPDRSISLKRNAGIEHAVGEIIAFTDDDCIPMIDWVGMGATYLELHKEVDGVEGFTKIDDVNNNSHLIKEYSRLEMPGFRTNNIFYRRNAIVEAGLFDTRFTVQREDMDLAFTLLTMGKSIDYCDDIRVVHRFREGEQWDLLKNCWNRRFDPLLYKKHRLLYRAAIRSPFPGTILMIGVVWIILLFAIFIGMENALLCTVAAIFLAGVYGTKRSDLDNLKFNKILSESISLIVAPIVLFAALICGSLKFRKLLIV